MVPMVPVMSTLEGRIAACRQLVLDGVHPQCKAKHATDSDGVVVEGYSMHLCKLKRAKGSILDQQGVHVALQVL